MPINYAKCTCGTESRDIVPIDKTGYRQLPNGHWRFDPSLPQTPPAPKKVKCTSCGKFNEPVPDPKAVDSFRQLNWLEN